MPEKGRFPIKLGILSFFYVSFAYSAEKIHAMEIPYQNEQFSMVVLSSSNQGSDTGT
jgi:hypothetical protein